MTNSGLLNPGVVEVIDTETQQLIGYAFTMENGRGQIQRWLLFQHPKNHFSVRAAPASMSQWSLADWQKHVTDSWRPNGYYVWAQADVYEYGGTYAGVTWNELPSAENMPAPSFPDRPGAGFQLDYLDGKLIHVRQEDVRGLAYVVRGLDDESSIEYWLLSAQYQAAGVSRTEIASGEAAASSLEAFVTPAQSMWNSGARLVITGCLNHHGEAAPFAP